MTRPVTNEDIMAKLDQILLIVTPKPKKTVEHTTQTLEPLKTQLNAFRSLYSPRELERFELYWTEPNKKGVERWQLQKTWDIGRRLKTWMMNKEDREYQASQRIALRQVNELPARENESRTDSTFTSFKDICQSSKKGIE